MEKIAPLSLKEMGVFFGINELTVITTIKSYR
jgi:hypothetical protein